MTHADGGKRYLVRCNYVIAPKSYVSDIELVDAKDYDAMKHRAEQAEADRDAIQVRYEASQRMASSLEKMASDNDQRADQAEAHLATATARVRAMRKQTQEMAELYRRQGNYERAAALFQMLEEWLAAEPVSDK